MNLSVIIPIYNEERTIGQIIEKVLAVRLPEGVEKEIILVDDCSTDRTPELLIPYKKLPHVRCFRHETNRGKTAALKTGFQNATGDIYLIQDADLEYSPEHYPALLAPILRGETAIVYGSRFKGNIRNIHWTNKYANVFSNFMFNRLYGTRLTDINTCFKVFRKEMLDGLSITSEYFTFETEMTAKWVNRKRTILEVPIAYTARTRQEGKKISWSKALNMFWGIFRFRKA